MIDFEDFQKYHLIANKTMHGFVSHRNVVVH